MTNAAQVSSDRLRQSLLGVLRLNNEHVFIRSLLSNLIFLDLAEFTKHNKDLEEVINLQSRALVRTSETNYQAWYALDDKHFDHARQGR